MGYRFVLIFILIAFSALSFSEETNPVTYVPHTSSYNYPPFPFTIAPGLSGTTEGAKCNVANTNSVCGPGLECVEEKLEAKWPDAPHRCHYRRPCKTGDVSPRQACKNSCNENPLCEAGCNGKPVKCTYEANCQFSYFIPRPADNVIVMGCEDHNECASGYCHKMNGVTSDPNAKICMPFSKCTKRCANYGETASAATDYCCVGLEKNSNNVCINPNMNIPELPDELEFEVNANNCQISQYEKKDGNRVTYPDNCF